jgi:hypothetical protein
MPTTHFDRRVAKGSQGGAAARVRYITWTLPDRAEAQVRYQGLVEGTTRQREDLVEWEARNLPGWAHGDAVTFFRAAWQYTSPAQIAYEEWKFALPRELSRAQQLAAARDFLTSTFGDTHPYVWAMHDPVAADGGHQPHVHVLWSARTLDGIERTPAQFFRQSSAAHPERGGAPRAREFSHVGAVKAARVHYTDVMNLYLEHAGIEARLHPDRLDARGILREPEPRLSPLDSQAFKRGEVTKAMQDVLDHRTRYGIARGEEQQVALAYWEERRQELGLTREMDAERSMTQIREARARMSREVPARDVADGEATMRLTMPFVGNRDSKIVHRPGDLNYGDVHPRKQVLFWTMADAEAAGFRAAVNQHYGRGAEQRREGVAGRGASASPSHAPSSRAAHLEGPAEGRTALRECTRRVLLLDDDMPGGLLAPDLDKKRGRDGVEW